MNTPSKTAVLAFMINQMASSWYVALLDKWTVSLLRLQLRPYPQTKPPDQARCIFGVEVSISNAGSQKWSPDAMRRAYQPQWV
jgi:hypothetical protein